MVRQLEKITVKKAQAKVVKCAKNKSWVPRNPLGHLSVNKGNVSAMFSATFNLVTRVGLPYLWKTERWLTTNLQV